MALGNEARLVLSFELVDKATQQATANLQKIRNEAKTTNSEVKKGFEQSADAQEKFAKSTSTSYQSLERSIGQASRSLVVLGGAITGVLGVAVNQASKSNYELFSALRSIRLAGEDVVQTIGVAMVPIMNNLAEKVKEGVKWFKNLDPTVRDNAVRLAAWVGGVALAIGTLGGFILRLIKIWETLGKIGDALKVPEISKFFLGGGLGTGLAMAAAGTMAINSVAKARGLSNETVGKTLNTQNLVQEIIMSLMNPVMAPVLLAKNFGMRTGRDLVNVGFKGFAGNAGREGGMFDLGSVRVTSTQNTKATEKQMETLKNKSFEVADQISNKFKIMAQQYMDSLGGMAGVTMTVIQTTIDGVTKGLGDSVAQAIVYGKDFAESMKAALQSLAAQIISFLVQTIAKIVVLRALGVVGPISTGALGLGGGSAGSGGDGGGGSSSGGGVGGFFKKIFGFAQGGTISEPVVGIGMQSGSGYTIAERGPEQIVPMGGRAGGFGGGNVTVNITNPQVRSQRDIDEIVYQVSKIFKRETLRA